LPILLIAQIIGFTESAGEVLLVQFKDCSKHPQSVHSSKNASFAIYWISA